MTEINYEKIEYELGIIVPNVYRRFIKEVDQNRYSLADYRIYDNTELIVNGNKALRAKLVDEDP